MSAEENMRKIIELDSDLRDKLRDLPDVLEYIKKLQKIVQKQVKKIIKWKQKVKEYRQRQGRDAASQTDIVLESLINSQIENNSSSSQNFEEKSIADDIREAAEQAVQSTGFVYEETSGLYYDYNSGYYYNAEYGLYYDGTSGTYLKYNQETQSYEYHSQVTPETKPSSQSLNKNKSPKAAKRKSKKEKPPKGAKKTRRRHYEADVEEGECSDSSTTSNEDNVSSLSESSDLCKQWPPCMRLIVESTEIPKIKVGSLFIVTCDGGSLGREGNHSICLPDVNVSKHHLKFSYNSESQKYTITDLGSRNGTMLNGKRVSASKQESDPLEVAHGSRIQLGSTVLLCHIHEGTQTCGHCEPGLLIESEKEPLAVGQNKKTLNQQFKSELKRLRKQHGFIGGGEDNTEVAAGYTDRAQKRRETVGSQNPYEKTQAASLEESISSENKGFKLLSKMGWKEGQSLGKDGTGRLEPVKLVSNVGSAGVGSEPIAPPPSAVSDGKKHTIWKKAQERFEKLPETKIFDEDSDS